MERPVGDKFKLNGCVYVVVADRSPNYDDSCSKCAFRDIACASIADIRGVCLDSARRDGRDVHFEQFGVGFCPLPTLRGTMMRDKKCLRWPIGHC